VFIFDTVLDVNVFRVFVHVSVVMWCNAAVRTRSL